MADLLLKYKYDLECDLSIDELYRGLKTPRKKHLENIHKNMEEFLDAFRNQFTELEKKTLLFVAKYHDVGYNESIKFSGNHGIDLALYLEKNFRQFDIDIELAVKLIIFHTYTNEGLDNTHYQLEEFQLDERTDFLIDLITYFDLHTNLLGKDASLESRINSIERRKKLSEDFIMYAYTVRDEILSFMSEHGKKALVFDVDNTVAFDNAFHEETIHELHRMQELEYEIVFNTGKLASALFDSEKLLNMNVHKICLNGNVISKDKTELRVVSDIERFKEEVHNELNESKIEYIDYTAYGVKENEFISDFNLNKIKVVGDYYPDFGDHKLVKIICFIDIDDNESKRKVDDIAKKYRLKSIRTSSVFYELCPKRSDKGTGMRQLLKELGVYYRNTLVFGDNYNDVPMLELAGKGYLMKSAPYYLRYKGYQTLQTEDEKVAVSKVLKNL